MAYFVAFVDDVNEAFDPVVHAVNDLDVFSIRISQSEGEFPACELEVVNPGVQALLDIQKPNLIISSDERGAPEVIFRGQIMSVPSEMFGDYVTLEVVARRKKSDMKSLALSLEATNEFDPLFVDVDQVPTEDWIRGRAADFHVDRRTLDLKLSDVLPGPDHSFLYLNDEVFDGSISLRIGTPPPSKVTQKVDIEWVQQKTVNVDIGGALNQVTEGATLTPDWLESILPGLGAGLPSDTGYTIGDIEIDRDQPGNSLSLNYYFYRGRDLKDKSLTVPEIATAGLVKHNFGYTKFPLTAHMQQPRREVINVEVSADHPLLFGDPAEPEELPSLVADDVARDHLTPRWTPNKSYSAGDQVHHNGRHYECNSDHRAFGSFSITASKWDVVTADNSPIGNIGSSSFLDVHRGRQTLEYALNVAVSEMKRRSRFIEVTFECELLAGFDLDCDTYVQIANAKLPGGVIDGKVQGYEIVDNGSSRHCAVTLHCAAVTGTTVLNTDVSGTYTDLDYDDGSYQAVNGTVEQSASSVDFKVSKTDAGNVSSLINLRSYDDTSFFEELSMTNTLSEQRYKLISNSLSPFSITGKSSVVAAGFPQKAADATLSESSVNMKYHIDHKKLSEELMNRISDIAEDLKPELTFKLRDLTASDEAVTEYDIQAVLNIGSGVSI